MILPHFILTYGVVAHVNHSVPRLLQMFGLHSSANPSTAPFEHLARLSKPLKKAIAVIFAALGERGEYLKLALTLLLNLFLAHV